MLICVLFLGLVALGKAQEQSNFSCGGTLCGTYGILQSPLFPNKYPNTIVCTWEIIAPPHHRITVEFTDFSLEKCSNCGCDYVDFRSVLPNNTMKPAGRFCGSTKPNIILSETNHMWVLFKTDQLTNMAGFMALFTATRNPYLDMDGCSNTVPLLSDSEVQKPSAKNRNVQWLLNRTKSRKDSDELPRAILSLFLAEPRFFAPENTTGSELRDRLNVRIFTQISRNATIRSQELAFYVQALMVVCEDPRDFFGRDLVSELRDRVDASSPFANPFEILALCNAGGNVTARDVDKVSAAFDSQQRPFWTDVQALATIALQCLSSKVTMDERVVRDMQDELKKRQFQNGTVENLATTGLVVQALRGNSSFFDLPSAIDVILQAQGEDGSWGGSIRNSFYLLPALSERSFLDIGHAHCLKTTESGKESLTPLQDSVGDSFAVQYTVWIGEGVEQGRFWKVRANEESSLYDVIEKVSHMDHTHNVTYQVVDGKPYVRSLMGKEDDPEMGIFWFIYVRPVNSTRPPTLLESSPADVLVNPNQEFILWYKPNNWRDEEVKRLL